MIRYSLVLVGLLLLAPLYGCTSRSDYTRQIQDLQTQLIELQRTTANLAIRLEELNNSMLVLHEAVQNNRQDLDRFNREFVRPQVIIGGSAPAAKSNGGFIDPQRSRGLAGISMAQLGNRENDSANSTENATDQGEIISAPPQGAALPEVCAPASGGENDLSSDGQADQAFDKARALYDSRDFGLAIFEINSLIRGFPKSDRVPRAQFLLGECYFELKDWSQALIEYDKVLKFGYDSQIQGSLFKIGLCYEYLGNKVRARSAYELLIRRDPNSEQATLAQQRLEGLP
ncbi:MAG: tetratricopeptide repeat protein [Candidatus Alcyoniella australis]|nr:tetratricopeptide repeat protein [Candidatus Alcyoniella australis]